MPLWSNSRYPIFYVFAHNRSFLVILPNFNLLRTLQRAFLDFYFREFSAAINFLCSKIGVNDVIFFKNTARIEIIITISSVIRTKKNKTFGPCIRAIFHTYSYYNFNPCGIFEKMTSYSPIFNQELEPGKLMAALNSRK